MSTIFITVTGNAANAKIPLLFLEDNNDVDRWIQIEDKYMKFDLPGVEGFNPKKTEAKRKPLTINNFKILYGLQPEDVNFLAGLVETEKVCMKSTKSKKQSNCFSLTSLYEVG
jgi:hypothetical protein